MVGNGYKLLFSELCPQVPIIIHNNSFSIPFYWLPIEGANVVLGMEWLRTFGPLMVDFSIPKISFYYNNNDITITSDPKSFPSPSSYNKLCHLLHTDSIAFIHLLLYQPNFELEPNSPTPSTESLEALTPSLPKQISNILHSYATYFEKPHGLPLSRPHDHRIPITPNTPTSMLNYTVIPTHKKMQWPQSSKTCYNRVLSNPITTHFCLMYY